MVCFKFELIWSRRTKTNENFISTFAKTFANSRLLIVFFWNANSDEIALQNFSWKPGVQQKRDEWEENLLPIEINVIEHCWLVSNSLIKSVFNYFYRCFQMKLHFNNFVCCFGEDRFQNKVIKGPERGEENLLTKTSSVFNRYYFLYQVFRMSYSRIWWAFNVRVCVCAFEKERKKLNVFDFLFNKGFTQNCSNKVPIGSFGTYSLVLRLVRSTVLKLSFCVRFLLFTWSDWKSVCVTEEQEDEAEEEKRKRKRKKSSKER